MTAITRPPNQPVSSPARAVATALALALLGLALPGAAAGAASPDRIQATDQTVTTTTRTTAGQTRRPTFAGRWTRQGEARAVVLLRGRNDVGRTTTYVATSPAPRLVRPGARSFCLRQDTRMTPTPPVPGTWSYTSVVTVERRGKVVHTSRVGGDYEPGSHALRRVVRTGSFAFRAGDTVTWRIKGEVTGQVDYVRTRATVSATC